MAATYITREGDTMDFIAWKHYGATTNRVVEKVLDANRGLADLGPILPAGLRIELPDVETPAKSQGVRLWD